LKIIQISASYKPAYIYGGPIQSVAKLCEALAALSNKREAGSKEINLQVLTTTANGASELEVSVGETILVEDVKVRYFKRWTRDHSHFSPRLLWRLRKEIVRSIQDDNKIEIPKRQTPNAKLIIHIHAWWNLVSVLSCMVAKWYNVPVLLSPRGMLTTYTQQNRHSFFKRLLHQSIGQNLLQYCHIHATSEQEKQDILGIVSPKSITVISNLVNIKHGAGHITQEQRPAFKLIFLSRIEEKKGLELLFDALSLLDIDWQLTIAGSGKEEYLSGLRAKTLSMRLNERINWIGQVSDQDKYGLMAKHDILVLTSFNENFANVVIESLSVGTPVLVSDQVGLSDYINEQQLGWTCKLDVIAVKDTLLNAYNDQNKRTNIRQSAPEIIRRDFNDQALAKRYLELYSRLAQ